MRKIGIFKGYPCYITTLKEYETSCEDSVVYVICDPGDNFDVNKPRNYAIVLNGIKFAVWDGKYVHECQPEEYAVSGQKIEKTEVKADIGCQNGRFSEYSDEFFKKLKD